MSVLFELPRATFLIYRLHIGMILGSRRSLAAIGLAAIPPLLAFLAARFAPENQSELSIFFKIGLLVLVQFVVPMLSVALGVGVVADEAEGRTITYPFTRAIPRASLFLGRWLAALTAVLALILASGVAMAVLVKAGGREEPPTAEFVQNMIQAALLGGVVYSAGSAVIGVLTKRGLIIALGYVFAIESLLSFVPGSTQRLTVQYHLRSMFVDRSTDGAKFLEELEFVTFMDPGEAITKMVVLTAIFLAVGCVTVTRKQFVLSS
ncbi:MAG: ABC transporter permease subunit [Planctomycetota bacterium]